MNEPQTLRPLLWTIVAGVTLWGVYHFVGVFRSRGDLVQSLFVAVSFAGFLGLWLGALYVRSRRLRNRARSAASRASSPTDIPSYR